MRRKTSFIFDIVCIVVIVTDIALGQSIITPPDDVTETVGATATFECQLDSGSREVKMAWLRNSDILYTFENGAESAKSHNKYSVNKIGSTFILSITNLDFSDGGMYRCATTTIYHDASLVVLDMPKLYKNEGSCEAEFGGTSNENIPPDQYPKLKIFFDEIQLEGETWVKFPDKKRDYFVMKKVPYPDKQANKDDDVFIRCEISTSKPAKSLAKNYLVFFKADGDTAARRSDHADEGISNDEGASSSSVPSSSSSEKSGRHQEL